MPRTLSSKNTENDTASAFSEIAGQNAVDFILRHAPKKVGTRFGKAMDHYEKARKLVGIDEEMGAIRCIAAEEELVVGVFELLKLREQVMPEHGDFIRKFKNHYVKLAFEPVLYVFSQILEDNFGKTFAPSGLGHAISWTARLEWEQDEIKLAILDDQGKELVRFNPLHINLEATMRPDTVRSLYEELSRMVLDRTNMKLKAFITNRAEYRNQLLYASDAGYLEMGETLQELMDSVFVHSYKRLIWTLALLLKNKPLSKEWGLVSQFISVYRMVLTETKLI